MGFTLKNYLGSVQLIIIGSCTSSSSSPRSTTAESTTKINMAAGDEAWKSAKSIYDFCVTDIEGNEVSLDKYKGKVCLIVNVASKWGFTAKNYTQLQALHVKLAEKGLAILAFPCNQFGSQEPGSNEQIKEFAQENYGAQFDLYSKIDVNGNKADPLYKFLKAKQKGTLGDFIKWNFSKFLVNKEGMPVKRYSPNTEPFSIEKDIEPLL